ncbi:MAG TPA: hypothetical protein VF762_20975 [Blastocatellia bacterium]|jgi:hypothetical protein
MSYLPRAGSEEFLIAINFSNRPFVWSVEVAGGATFVDVTPGLKDTFEKEVRPRPVALPSLTLDSFAFRIFRRASR